MTHLQDSLSSLLCPFLGVATQFIFRLNVAKFLRGFLGRINDSVKMYTEFLRKRYWLIPYDAETMDEKLDIFLWSELQRNHQLHPSIALTNDPQEVRPFFSFFLSFFLPSRETPPAF